MTSLSDAFEQASDAVFALLAQVRQKPTESRLEFSEIQANRLGDSFLVDLYLRSLVIPVWASNNCTLPKVVIPCKVLRSSEISDAFAKPSTVLPCLCP